MSPRGAYVPLATSPSGAVSALADADDHDPGLSHAQRVLSNERGGYSYDDEHHAAHGGHALAHEVDEGAVVVPGEESVTPFVWALVGAAAISGLLFGCV